MAICRPIGQHGGTYISHLRSEGDQFLECLDELLRIGQEAGCRAEVYHLKAAGQHQLAQDGAGDRAHRGGSRGRPACGREHVPLHRRRHRARVVDPAPVPRRRTCATARTPRRPCDPSRDRGSGARAVGRLREPLPRRRWRRWCAVRRRPARRNARTRPHTHRGELARSGSTTPWTGFSQVVARAPEIGVLYFLIDESNVELGLSRDWVSLGSDAHAGDRSQDGTALGGHPRAYGTFARFLGHYVRDRGVTSFSEAVRRMSRLPADELGLAGPRPRRGRRLRRPRRARPRHRDRPRDLRRS